MQLGEKKYYWKEISLVIIGALLASVPTLMSTRMSIQGQVKQLILDRQISALREYSIANQRLATEVFIVLNQFTSLLQDSETEFNIRKNLPQQRWIQIREQFIKVESQYRIYVSELNTQTLIINALYKTDFPQERFKIWGEGIDDNNKKLSDEKLLADMLRQVLSTKKEFIERVNIGQIRIGQLSLLLKTNESE